MGEHDLVKRFESLYTRLKDIIVCAGLENCATINEDLLGSAIRDYFEDIDRLKDYEGIERVNTSKIYAYEAYWLARRKPIQVDSSKVKDDKWTNINEIAVAIMLLAKMGKEKRVEFSTDSEEFLRFFDLLYYNLCYRDYNQKSLELMIEAFYLGCSMG